MLAMLSSLAKWMRTISLENIIPLPSHIAAPWQLPHENPRLRLFLQFLEDALAVVAGPVASPNAYQIALATKMDKLLPFRELAPSRPRAIESGLFSSPATQSTFFSALIFRGITWGTPFFLDSGSPRQEASDVLVQSGELAPSLSFFCDSAAYGQPNDGWNVELGATYEKAVENHSLKNFLTRIMTKDSERHMPTFREC
ncbi:hypothetical protein K438DRAFT_1771619 [Mycena galopus ATCC 62051]|nr:hypothetical protein K438DRAFT_1771619 [Mycena galopus ATCC 62051]